MIVHLSTTMRSALELYVIIFSQLSVFFSTACLATARRLAYGCTVSVSVIGCCCSQLCNEGNISAYNTDSRVATNP